MINYVIIVAGIVVSFQASYIENLESTGNSLNIHDASKKISISIEEPYAKLSKKLDGQLVYLRDDKLYFIYTEEYAPNTLKYNVYDEEHDAYITHSDQPLSPAYGDNRFILDFDSGGDCLRTRVNILEVINDKGEKWYIRFKQNGTICP